MKYAAVWCGLICAAGLSVASPAYAIDSATQLTKNNSSSSNVSYKFAGTRIDKRPVPGPKGLWGLRKTKVMMTVGDGTHVPGLSGGIHSPEHWLGHFYQHNVEFYNHGKDTSGQVYSDVVNKLENFASTHPGAELWVHVRGNVPTRTTVFGSMGGAYSYRADNPSDAIVKLTLNPQTKKAVTEVISGPRELLNKEFSIDEFSQVITDRTSHGYNSQPQTEYERHITQTDTPTFKVGSMLWRQHETPQTERGN